MHGTVLDCCSNTLPVGQDFKVVIPMNETKQFLPPPANFYFANSSVHAPCDMEIPGRSIQLIVGRLENPSGDNSVMLVEPILNLPDQLYVGHSLSSVCRNQLPIQIINISPPPVKVYKGMKLVL